MAIPSHACSLSQVPRQRLRKSPQVTHILLPTHQPKYKEPRSLLVWAVRGSAYREAAELHYNHSALPDLKTADAVWYTAIMTEADVIAHWRKGATDALEMARLACDAGKYDHALFNCHLAVEKALKVKYMEQHNAEAPYTHNLLELAGLLPNPWTEQVKTILDRLSDFVVAARYSDPVWAEKYADLSHANECIADAARLLSSLGI